MASARSSRDSHLPERPWQCVLFALLLGALLVGFVCFQWPALDKAYWEYDEGLNVIKAQLVGAGHWPHRDIWSDQPPLLTLVLAGVFSLLGPSVMVGRALLLVSAVVLILATAWVTAQMAGRWSALGAALLLVLSPMVQELGRTIMIGLPAVALGMLAIGCALLARQGNSARWLLLAGLCFGLGMLVKPLIAPYYLPLLMLAGWPEIRSWRPCWRSLLHLHLAPALLLVVTVLTFGPRSFLGQVVGTFAEARDAYGFSLAANLLEVRASFGSGYYPGLILLVVLGAAALIVRRNRRHWWAVAWLLSAAIAVVWHTPQRWHEHLLLLPPFATLAMIVPGQLSALSTRRGVRILAWVATTVAILTLLIGLPMTLRQSLTARAAPLKSGSKAAESQLGLNLLRQHTSPGDTIIVDDPMLAFQTGTTVPPMLAVPSLRRLKSGGGITSNDLIALCEQQPIAAVAFWEQRLERLPEFHEWARTHLALRASKTRRWFYLPATPRWPQEACAPEGICLLGSSADTLAVDAGRRLSLALYWRASSDIAGRHTLFVHLVDEDGQPWAQADLTPFLLTDRWRAGDIIYTEAELLVSRDAPAGPLLLSVGWYDLDGERLAFVDGLGQELPGKQIALTPRPVVRREMPPPEPPTVPVDAALSDLALLQGYDLALADDGRAVDLTLHWRAQRDALTSYKVFVHLVQADASGETMVAQSDQEPGAGRMPTTGWRQGDAITDTHRIALPERPPAGLQLYVGMYDPDTLERLPASAAAQPRADGRISLGVLTLTDLP